MKELGLLEAGRVLLQRLYRLAAFRITSRQVTVKGKALSVQAGCHQGKQAVMMARPSGLTVMCLR